MSIPAKYEPGRDKDGKFAPGNKIAPGHNNPMIRKFNEVQAMFFDATGPEDMDKVVKELVWLTSQRDNLDVKLKSIVYFCDRILGKPKERIEAEISDSRPVVPAFITAEEEKVIGELISRVTSMGGESQPQ